MTALREKFERAFDRGLRDSPFPKRVFDGSLHAQGVAESLHVTRCFDSFHHVAD